MKIEVNLEKKGMFVILAAALIIAGAIVVYAYTSVPNPGHGASSVVVTAGGVEMTLQEAIDNSKLGGTGNIINGSGIVFSTVSGKTMINASTTGYYYQCPDWAAYGGVSNGWGGLVTYSCSSSPPASACRGQLTTSYYCQVYVCTQYGWQASVSYGLGNGNDNCVGVGYFIK